MRFAFLAVLLFPGTLAAPARAGWAPVLAGRIERVVASRDYVAVLVNEGVVLLGEDGQILGRRPPEAAAERPPIGRSGHTEADWLLDLLEIPEIDRGTDYADELVAEDSSLAARRSLRNNRVTGGATSRFLPTLAATQSTIWIADQRGLSYLSSDGSVIRELGRVVPGSLLAATEQHLLMHRGGHLELRTHDGSLQRDVQEASAIMKVALSVSGERMAWAWDNRIAWVDDTQTWGMQTMELTSPAVDLTYCDERLVVLQKGEILSIIPGNLPAVRSSPPTASRLLCPSDHTMPWLAWEPGLSVSADLGRHWQTMDVPSGVLLVDVAASTHHIWLATSNGLFYSSDDGTAEHLARQRLRSPPQRIHLHPLHKKASQWLAWLPKVTLRGLAAFAPGSQRLEVAALMAVPLDGKTPRIVPVSALTLQEDNEQTEPVPVLRGKPFELPADRRDPDLGCLLDTRRKSVELSMAEPERARSYLVRSSRTGWLPELRVLVSRRYGRSESLDLNTSSTALSSPLGIDTVNDIRYEARVTWDLARLVFSSEELSAQTQALHMAELRRDIETTVNRLYFERRRIILEGSGGRGDAVRRDVRLHEIEAELDSMSAGSFSACTVGKATGE